MLASHPRRRPVLAALALPLIVSSPFVQARTSARMALDALLAHAKTSESDRLLVMQDGKPVLDYHRDGVRDEQKFEMMSCTKSLVALGIGRLLTQGKLRSLDQPVSDFHPEWKQGRKAEITLRMLLNHTSGLQNVLNAAIEIYPAPDAQQLALAAELSDPPGKSYAYNNKATNLLAGVVEKATRQRMDIYLEQEVLRPIGARGPIWSQSGFDKAGHPYAMAGWISNARDAARVGQLLLDEGKVNGTVLIDPAFMREMVAQSQPYQAAQGLLWLRHSEHMSWTVHAAGLDRLAAAGLSTASVDRLRPLVGRSYADVREVQVAIDEALGAERPVFMAELNRSGNALGAIVRREVGAIEAYGAEGFLGQYIVVVPAARLIAVRQIAPRSDLTGDKPWPYGFPDFASRVIETSHALERVSPSVSIGS